MKVEIPLSAETANECDYNNGYDPANKRQFDWTKLRSIGIGVWGSHYNYGEGYSCNLVIDDVRLLSHKPLGNVKYTINYQTNGGELPADAVTVNEQGQQITLATPTRSGYKFVGWYTQEDLTGSPVTEISATQTGDVTLYAAWEATGGCGSSVSAGFSGIAGLALAAGLAIKRRKK